ncbi:DNA-binding protein [Pleurocapsales cyanobacterium LEGE 10410]|nr:DNA-binding protein [Pleurocapsales cyanobacterium LEGE 10410]
MTVVEIHHNPNLLSPFAPQLIPVQIYGNDGRKQGKIAVIGNPVIDPIKRLGVSISAIEFDFLTLALAVTAADTFIQRKFSADGWTREINLEVPLYKPLVWKNQKNKLEQALNFLSGDLWNINITASGMKPPQPYTKKQRHRLTPLKGRDCVCLFSGGLDSAIGAIDLIEKKRSPLLVSHSYKGDKSYQEDIANNISGDFSRFSVNAHPISINGKTDISMRTRSFNFLAFGAVGANAVAQINKLEKVNLFVPENGFISLNAPLTPRRIGSLSTRTTHPYFFQLIQEIFDSVGIKTEIVNPYQFKTKGEMLIDCKDQKVLQNIVSNTVSCSKWKRDKIQCGKCVPCIIRRSSIFVSNTTESTSYKYQNLLAEIKHPERCDDLFALMIAIKKLPTAKIGAWISSSGPLSNDPINWKQYKQVFSKGMDEVKNFLIKEGLI